MSCLAVDVVVAARIEQMKKLSREQPDQPCTRIFSHDEMQVLAANFQPEALRTGRLLTLREAVRYTAQLGGFHCAQERRRARLQDAVARS